MNSVGSIIVEDPKEVLLILEIGRFEYKGRSFLARPHMNKNQLKKKKNEIKKKRVFVHNIHSNIDSSELLEALCKISDVEEAYVIKKRSEKRNGGNTKNYGYATFRTVTTANELIEKGFFYIGNWRVKVDPFKEREEELEEEKNFTKKNPKNVNNMKKIPTSDRPEFLPHFISKNTRLRSFCYKNANWEKREVFQVNEENLKFVMSSFSKNLRKVEGFLDHSFDNIRMNKDENRSHEFYYEVEVGRNVNESYSNYWRN